MKDELKRCGNKLCAVGGWKCPCCGPKRRERQRYRRIARRILKQKLLKEINPA